MLYMGIILRAHAVRDESHIQRNANVEVAPVSCEHYDPKCHIASPRVKTSAKKRLRRSPLYFDGAHSFMGKITFGINFEGLRY